jgi:O-antigen/teichoic acid export membrane protein
MSIARKAISGGLWMTGINYTSFAINLLGQLVLARLLFPEDFGIFSMALATSELLFFVMDFSFSMACIQLQDEKDVFDTGIVICLLTSLIIIVLAGALSFGASFFYSRKIVLFVFVLCMIRIFSLPASIYSAYMEKNLLFRRNALIIGSTRSSAVVIAIGLAALGFGVWSLLLREILATGSLFIGMLIFSPYSFTWKFNKSAAIKIWKFGYRLLFLNMIEKVFMRLPIVLSGLFVGTVFVGLFERSLYLAGLPNTALAQISAKVAFPVYSKFKNNKEKIAEGVFWNLTIIFSLLSPVALLVFLFPESIITILLGDKWAQAAPLFQGFSLFLLIAPVFAVLKYALLATGNIIDVAVGRLICVTFVVTWIATSFYSRNQWIYVPWAMSSGLLVSVFWLSWRVRLIDIQIPWLNIISFPVLLSFLILGLGYYLTQNLVNTFIIMGILLTIWTVSILVIEHGKIVKLYHRISN